MHNLFIVEILNAGRYFLPVSFDSTQWNLEKAVLGKVLRYGRSGSFKVNEIGTNWKPTRVFLLEFCCNYMPISEI